MKQHMLVTYSIFKLQIKIPVVCLKLSLFLCKEEETHQTCLKVSRVNTDTNEASEKASRPAKRQCHQESLFCVTAPCQGTEEAGGTDTAALWTGTIALSAHTPSVLCTHPAVMPALVLRVVHLLLDKNYHLTRGAQYPCPTPAIPHEASGAVAISLLLVTFLQYKYFS